MSRRTGPRDVARDATGGRVAGGRGMGGRGSDRGRAPAQRYDAGAAAVSAVGEEPPPHVVRATVPSPATARDGASQAAGGPATVKVLVPGEHSMVALLGTRDELLRLVEEAFRADIHVRGNEISVTADDSAEADRVAHLFEELVLLLQRGQAIDRGTVAQTIRIIRDESGARPSEVLSDVLVTHRGRVVRPKTLGQKRYLDAIRANTVTFGIGPAGTGKTYLAMGAAVQALRTKQVNRLILTRPAVEAGERLGFLPGTLHEKIDPYLKPLWDALQDMMEADELVAHVDRGTIEVAPLAYMRGRTLNDAFVVLDEAQNTTPEQMKMFLTRIGFNSRVVVTGDISQVDLPSGKPSGLRVVRDILGDIDGVAFAILDAADVVRHPIVQRIVEAYERHGAAAPVSARAMSGAGADTDTEERPGTDDAGEGV